MADHGISAAFPAPPAHYLLFTDENVRRVKDEHAIDDDAGEEVRKLMRPPAPPTEDYAVFGQRVPVCYTFDTISLPY